MTNKSKKQEAKTTTATPDFENLDLPKAPEQSAQVVQQVEKPAENLDNDGIETYNQPEQKFQVQKAVEDAVPKAIVHPKILAGVCEFHGQDHRECDHYRGVSMSCSYCGKDYTGRPGEDNLWQRKLFVYSLPERPNTLITVCEDFSCIDKHRKKFMNRDNF